MSMAEHSRRKQVWTEAKPPLYGDSAMAVANYVRELTCGIRVLTRKRKDLKFLDYLLAVVEDEASTLAKHVYH